LIKLIKTIPSQIVSNLKYFEFLETLSATKQKETNEERGKIATQTHITINTKTRTKITEYKKVSLKSNRRERERENG
jgi:hypothetical protein